jgi:hypothetical protein
LPITSATGRDADIVGAGIAPVVGEDCAGSGCGKGAIASIGLFSVPRLTTSPETSESPSVTNAKTPGSTAFHMSAPVLFWLDAPIANEAPSYKLFN